MGKYYRFVFEKKRINGYSQSVALLPPTPGEVACDWSKAQRRLCLIGGARCLSVLQQMALTRALLPKINIVCVIVMSGDNVRAENHTFPD